MTAVMYTSNHRTRDEFLHAVLYSGEVTRVGQHLALVLYYVCGATNNVAKLSMRDLEQTTGWGRQTILDHLSEIHMFFKFTASRGRGKSSFEMQGAIEQYVNDVRSVRQPDATCVRQTDTKVIVREADASSVREPDKNGSVREPDATPDTNPAVYDSHARALTTTVVKNANHGLSTLATVERVSPDTAVHVQHEGGTLQQQPVASGPVAADSAAVRCDLMASLRTIEEAATDDAKLAKADEHGERCKILWPRMTPADQALVEAEQVRLRPLVKRLAQQAKLRERAAAGLRENAKLEKARGEALGMIARANDAGIVAAIRQQYAWLLAALPGPWADSLAHAFDARLSALGGSGLLDGIIT